MDRPVVGIVGHGHAVPRPFGVLPVLGTPTWFVEAVAAAGGRPVLLPGAVAGDLLDVVDALVLTGGGDLSSGLTGADPSVVVDASPVRDRDELAVVRAASAALVPVLGVCRGMQLLAVAGGGRLVADLGRAHVLPAGGHPVTTRAGSRVAGLLGPRPRVTSLHHQAVLDPGPAWTATAWADDGTLEALEPTTGWPALAVQWHPEHAADGTGPALFGWLVEQAASYRLVGAPG